MTHRIASVLAVRIYQLKQLSERDRGDSPVPTALIIAGLIIVGIAVLTWAGIRARAYMNSGNLNPPAVPN